MFQMVLLIIPVSSKRQLTPTPQFPDWRNWPSLQIWFFDDSTHIRHVALTPFKSDSLARSQRTLTPFPLVKLPFEPKRQGYERTYHLHQGNHKFEYHIHDFDLFSVTIKILFCRPWPFEFLFCCWFIKWLYRVPNSMFDPPTCIKYKQRTWKNN